MGNVAMARPAIVAKHGQRTSAGSPHPVSALDQRLQTCRCGVTCVVFAVGHLLPACGQLQNNAALRELKRGAKLRRFAHGIDISEIELLVLKPQNLLRKALDMSVPACFGFA